MGIAFLVSKRSRDPNTHHGCVLTDKNNHIISTGYNSWPYGMKDENIPLNRPDPNDPNKPSKYDFVEGTHSERNSISHCLINPWLLVGGATAFVTGKPCNGCLGSMRNANVTKIVYAKRRGSILLNKRTDDVFNQIIGDTGIEVVEVVPNLSWLVEQNFLDELKNLGFL